MTEDEAREKICHRTLGMTIATNAIRPSNCIASACMAWRERSVGNRNNPPGGPDQRWATNDGFCGLAGQLP